MKSNHRKAPDRELDDMENQISGQARVATSTAHSRALAASPDGVLVIEAGNLVRISQDGQKVVVAKAKPRRKVKVGEVIHVRRIEG
ncbi:hypothetical protein KSS93_24940 [Pseudomonas xanthosomatis]|uniref:Uncharacterized protein n=1 Tax=Pseudomonas fakonensis TaxID=2842355 RepID=A0ABX8N5L2_9PSED|nr:MULTISPECIES: hypothetical protein [Pseudomonas]QXH46073.1 hypothetical protein KSS93_24940 [Pseudomonas xanthosomatis]QXH50667.1 hypothetical protein KSS94_22395 [Pseudomonas fakonensis]